jgi:hypothetical protein
VITYINPPTHTHTHIYKSQKVNTSRIVEEAVGQRYAAPTIKKAIGIMVMKNELKEFNHGRLVERIR